MDEIYDVIVIGAGPAGSMAARTLAERKKRVLLLEKGVFPGRRKACGGMMPYSTFKECGIAEDVIEAKTEREIFDFPWHRRITFQSNVIVQRSLFDEQLALSARNTGADFVMSCQVLDVIKEKDGNVRIEGVSNGAKRVFKSAIVIFADGVHTLAPRTMGIGFKKRKSNIGFGLEYTVEAPDNWLQDYYIFFGEIGIGWGYVWVFPNRDLLNVGIYLLPGNVRRHPDKKDMLNFQITMGTKELRQLLGGRKIVKRIGGYIPLEPASSLCSDSALVVGDAAGLVFPLTAGGIGTALMSGKLAGEAADDALSHRLSLSSYESAIKSSSFYRTMKKESRMLRIFHSYACVNQMFYSKLFYLWKLKSELSSVNALKIFCYPLLRGFKQKE